MNDKILTANRLSDGVVIFLAADGRWVETVDDARVEADGTGHQALETAGRAAVADQHLVEPYLIDVTRRADGRIFPTRYRERVRAAGPSIRLDLGKQAEGKSSLTHDEKAA